MYREYPAQVLVVTAEQEVKDGNHVVRKASSPSQSLMYWPVFSASILLVQITCQTSALVKVLFPMALRTLECHLSVTVGGHCPNSGRHLKAAKSSHIAESHELLVHSGWP